MFSNNIKHKFCISLLLLLAIIMLPKATIAQEISTIEVEGNRRVEVATVRSYLTFSEGQSLNVGDVDNSIKNLFATGLFADVSVINKDNTLVVNVAENPIVNRVAFEGNKRIDNDELKQEIRLQSREVYTKSRVQADVKRIIDLYSKSGRFSAQVTPKAIQLDI